MKYSETGFRAVYKNFCVFPMVEKIASVVEMFPGYGEADCCLGYGYVDHTAGVSLEVLALGKTTEDGFFQFFDGNDKVSGKIRIGAVQDEEFTIIEPGDLKEKYSEKIKAIDEGYRTSDEVEKSRDMDFLDGCRHEHFADDILVYTMKEGLEPEGCWTRIIGLGDHAIIGELLNEPNQDFGYHLGEKIGFFVHENDDGRILCVSDMNPSRRLTAKDLEDGSLLKEAIKEFNANRTEMNWVEVVELLRDSLVWIPCNAIIGEKDQEAWLKMIEEANGDTDALIGKVLTNQENIRMVPDILQNGDDFFFPVFSSEEEMDEYGNGFSKIQNHMLEAISMARNNERDLKGIVVNAFSEPFVIEMDLVDIIENAKSRIVESDEEEEKKES